MGKEYLSNVWGWIQLSNPCPQPAPSSHRVYIDRCITNLGMPREVNFEILNMKNGPSEGEQSCLQSDMNQHKSVLFIHFKGEYIAIISLAQIRQACSSLAKESSAIELYL